MNWFYDNAAQNLSAATVEIDRVYCFQFNSFSDEDWSKMEEIYATLPGPRYQDVVPFWYGLEDAPFYLCASIEPPGLQVAGTLRRADWLAWDAAFRQQVDQLGLPRYEVD